MNQFRSPICIPGIKKVADSIKCKKYMYLSFKELHKHMPCRSRTALFSISPADHFVDLQKRNVRFVSDQTTVMGLCPPESRPLTIDIFHLLHSTVHPPKPRHYLKYGYQKLI